MMHPQQSKSLPITYKKSAPPSLHDELSLRKQDQVDKATNALNNPSLRQNGGANVGELVGKAKKAASSLWMILHAQNCRLNPDSCPHPGCSSTKQILMHVKICAAGPGFPCPTNYRGCNETRKLLAHYRRCKDIRTKQVSSGLRPSRQQPQVCLVCSLMARHAKNMLEGSKTSSRSNMASVLVNSSPSTSFDPKFNVERGFANLKPTEPTRSKENCPRQQQKQSRSDRIERTPSMILMPPPPPRPRLIRVTSNNKIPGEIGSPPTQSQLMCARITAVAAITDPTRSPNSLSDPSLLCKSVDSSCFPVANPVPSHLKASGFSDNNTRRQRAESYDERSVSSKKNDCVENQRNKHDLSDTERKPSHPPSVDKLRPRSASCSNMSQSYYGCHTITEEDREHANVFPLD